MFPISLSRLLPRYFRERSHNFHFISVQRLVRVPGRIFSPCHISSVCTCALAPLPLAIPLFLLRPCSVANLLHRVFPSQLLRINLFFLVPNHFLFKLYIFFFFSCLQQEVKEEGAGQLPLLEQLQTKPHSLVVHQRDIMPILVPRATWSAASWGQALVLSPGYPPRYLVCLLHAMCGVNAVDQTWIASHHPLPSVEYCLKSWHWPESWSLSRTLKAALKLGYALGH